MNKLTSSLKQQTKDQGPDPIQFLFKEEIYFFSKAANEGPEYIQFLLKKEIDFFSKAADQRPRTRSYSAPLR
jgi:hypothetical protein